MNEDLFSTDLNEIVINDIMNSGLFPHQKESMDIFYVEGLNLILTKLFKIEKMVANIRVETEMDRNIATIKFEVIFTKVNLIKPFDIDNKPLFPADCRLKDRTYCGNLLADITVRSTAYLKDGNQIVKEANLENHLIAELPIMIGSKFCHTYGLSPIALEHVSEDPGDPQGYFIINGSEWSVNNLVSRKYNIWYAYHNEHNKEHARSEFISQPGDSFENSSEMIIRYMFDGSLTITLTSDKYFKELEIPFFVILKILGLVTEKSIIDNIIPLSFSQGEKDGEKGGERDSEESEVKNDLAYKMREILETAFLVKYPQCQQDLRLINDFGNLGEALIHELAVKYIATKGATSLEERQKNLRLEEDILREKIMENFDNNILPHIGKSPEHRFEKALNICIGIRKMLEVYYDIIPSTDRDSHEMQRVHPSGDSFAKMFKKEFNRAIVNPMRLIFENMANTSSFNDHDLVAAVKAGCKSSSLKARIISNINQGMSEKVVDGQIIKNRMPSENLKRKNHLNLINNGTIKRSLNSTQVFSNERSREIREAQSSQAHTACPLQTSEGVAVGMVQNTTLGLKISTSTSTEIMKSVLFELVGRKDQLEIIPYQKIFGINNSFTKVLVNGLWIGYSKNPAALYRYFKDRRRGWDILRPETINSFSQGEKGSEKGSEKGTRKEKDIMDRHLTISWNNVQKEFDFRTDRGRSLSPMVIVYNNLTVIGQKLLGTKCNPKTGEGFEQRTLITKEIIKDLRKGTISTQELFDRGMIDYIAPEELRQITCAENLETLEEHKNDFYTLYTHVCIPATLLSLTSSVTPFLHNGPPTRASLAGNHIRQSCGYYATNFNKRFDKQGYNLIHTQVPLVPTITNRFTIGFGQNPEVAIVPYGGTNIEDSLTLNESAAQRGAFNLNKYTFIKVTLEKDEIFGIPDEKNTDNIRHKTANYSKLGPLGFVPRGTRVNYGDVLIGKLIKYTEIKVNNKIYKDVSEIYEEQETAYVVGVETGVDGELKSFVKIRLEIPRVLSKGQKFASRNGQKGMTAASCTQSDMPFTSAGIIPTFLLGPHAFPSRMTINQLFESFYSKLASIKGCLFDGSFTVKTSIPWVAKELRARGYHHNGTEIMFNGRTGKYMNCNIFIAPTYYGRLQKFSEEGAYAVGETGQKSFVTRLPISGRARNGGIRLGEMEINNLHSHGCMRFLHSKLRNDCDGIDIYICRNCGNKCVGNDKNNYYQCNFCGPKARVFKFPTRFSAYSLLTKFEGLGARIKFITAPYRFQN
jgi:DNA-directed RNA polymerase beta subunit